MIKIMGLQISWKKLHGDALCSTKMVQKYFVCMIHVQRKENLVSTFFLRNVYYCDIVLYHSSWSFHLHFKGPIIR